MTEPLDLERPRTVLEIFGTCLRLYARYPLLFATIAFGVVGAFDLVVVALGGSGPGGIGHASATGGAVDSFGGLLVEVPLITALHAVAVMEIARGERPSLSRTLATGFGVAGSVALVVFLTTLGIGLGILALVIPGIVLSLRWHVSAQTVVVEGVTGRAALRRSAQLVSGSYGRVLMIAVTPGVLGTPGAFLLRDLYSHLTPGAFVAGLLIETVAISFGALTTAILYFDLRARETMRPAQTRHKDSAGPPADLDPGPR